jgi:hypothetical protein
MADADIITGLPSTLSGAAGGQNLCDECEHPAIIPPRNPSLVRTLLGVKRRATCVVLVQDVSGWGSQHCGCRNSSHGS